MKVHCENCDGYYEITNAWRTRLVMSVLFFAKCSICGALRDPRSADAPYPRCVVCNCPGVKKMGMCQADYMVWYRKHRVTICE